LYDINYDSKQYIFTIHKYSLDSVTEQEG